MKIFVSFGVVVSLAFCKREVGSGETIKKKVAGVT